MAISRRNFFGAATGAAAAFIGAAMRRGRTLEGDRTEESPSARAHAVDCVLLDCGEACSLSESLRGFEIALARARVPFVKITDGPLPRCRKLIIPGCAAHSPAFASAVRGALENGSSVVLECGGMFAGMPEFIKHRDFLRSHFDLEVGSPARLWEGADARRRVPYVDYVWPQRVKVRDFSRIVPISSAAGDVIAWAGSAPIALKRRMGKGTLVFLGSPLGPLLLAGDREARNLSGMLVASV